VHSLVQTAGQEGEEGRKGGGKIVLHCWFSRSKGGRKREGETWWVLVLHCGEKKGKGGSSLFLSPWLSERRRKEKVMALRTLTWFYPACGQGGEKKKKRKGKGEKI